MLCIHTKLEILPFLLKDCNGPPACPKEKLWNPKFALVPGSLSGHSDRIISEIDTLVNYHIVII